MCIEIKTTQECLFFSTDRAPWHRRITIKENRRGSQRRPLSRRGTPGLSSARGADGEDFAGADADDGPELVDGSDGESDTSLSNQSGDRF